MICAKLKNNKLYASQFNEVFATLTNLINNSSFEENSYWSGVVYNTEQYLFGNRSSKLAGTTVPTIPIPTPIVGHKYYGRMYLKSNGNINAADARFEMFAGDGYGLNWVFATNSGNVPNWEMRSGIADVQAVNGTSYVIRSFVVNAQSICWNDGMMLIDLTEAFGQGNEPSQSWCDTNIPYFNGTYELSNNLVNIGVNGINLNELNDNSNNVYIDSTGKIYSNQMVECINLNNLCPDGNMETNGWVLPGHSGYDTTIYKYGTRSLRIGGLSTMPENVSPSVSMIPLVNNHIYYIRLEAYQEQVVGGVGFYWPIAEPSFGSIGAKAPNQWNLYSYIGTRSTFTNGSYQCRLDFDNNYNNGNLWIDGVAIIDLTESFGAGNEPTKEWCDTNIPFFENNYELRFGGDDSTWLF